MLTWSILVATSSSVGLAAVPIAVLSPSSLCLPSLVLFDEGIKGQGESLWLLLHFEIVNYDA